MEIKTILLIQNLIQPVSWCIVVQPQKSLTKRKDFWAHGKVKIGKRHKSHSASNFTHIHTLCILFSSWIASVKQASCTVIWFLKFHSEIDVLHIRFRIQIRLGLQSTNHQTLLKLLVNTQFLNEWFCFKFCNWIFLFFRSKLVTYFPNDILDLAHSELQAA